MGSLDNDNKFLKAISSKTSISSTTMTTTISKHNLQHQNESRTLRLKSAAAANENTNIIAKATTKTTEKSTSSMHKYLDSASTTVIQIDKLNNNGTTAKTPTTVINNHVDNEENGIYQPKVQKRRSLLNFKSLDFHIKYLYAGLRGNTRKTSCTKSLGINVVNGDAEHEENMDMVGAPPPYNRIPPYLKIEAVDSEESANLLLDYPQSPYSSRRNSSNDDHRSSSQLLHINRYEVSRSQGSSPASHYFLSPYAIDSTANVRRSSASDILSCKRSGSTSTSYSRRPSTTDLLRKARERRGTEARMGRSASHSGLTRGGFRGGGAGGRRTSMVF